MNFKISKMMAKKDFQKEFSDFMLKAVSIPNVISFAGGMPNPISFPNKELKKAYSFVMDNNYKTALQYANTQGYIELRKIIAQRYKTKENINLEADDILIINGAQQGFDMISAVVLNDNDNVIVEAPAFLAAIQTFNLYNAKIHSIEISNEGINLYELKNILKRYKSKLFYTIPNFQNPTGLTYNNSTRKIIADMIKKTNTILIEDNPYGALRFKGENQESFFNLLDEQVILMGSFSKTISPGIRVGWLASKNKEFIKKAIEYKQILDVHTSMPDQMAIAQYINNTNFDMHIEKIRKLYHKQCNAMINAIEKYFPKEVKYTKPEGGMFIWVELPKNIKSVELANETIKRNVAISPGDPFYNKKRNVSTFRLSYSNCSVENIDKGMKIIGETIDKMLKSK